MGCDEDTKRMSYMYGAQVVDQRHFLRIEGAFATAEEIIAWCKQVNREIEEKADETD